MNNKVAVTAPCTIILGDYEIKGGANGTYCSIKQDSPNILSETGSHGETGYKVLQNRPKKAEITILKTSPDNQILSLLFNTVCLQGQALPFMYKCQNTVVACPAAMITKHPDLEDTTDSVGNNVWEIELPNTTTNIGGGNQLV